MMMQARKEQTPPKTGFDPTTAKVFIGEHEMKPMTEAEVTFDSEAPKKPESPMKEAVRLQAALDKIDARELSTMNNTRARYDAERAALRDAASSAAKRILAAAEEEPGT